ncbi:MAG TPA: DNA-directed DNA polymerase [Candidatus Bathyarchaeia archaeon]|nr:DNA-directed DNA polymerase [Candidatus Bathyarchaeia archaeon]
MKQTFWLLDLNQQIYNGKSSIWMWGLDRQGKRVLIIDPHFQPYFYLQPGLSQDADQLRIQHESDKPHPTIDHAKVETKKLLSDEVSVLKVYCNDPFSVEKAAKITVKKLGAAASFEADLRQATKYVNEYGIKPGRWYEVEADKPVEDIQQYSADIVVITNEPPVPASTEESPKLVLFAFALLVSSRAGLPSPRRDPVQAIAWTTSEGKSGLIESSDRSDRELLEQFTTELTKANPDVVLSFGGNTAHWPYLVKRAEEAGVDLKVGRQESTPHQSLYGHVSLTGRANIDLMDFVGYLDDIKNKTLQNLAKYFGVRAPETQIEETEFHHHWSTPKGRKILIDQLKHEADTILAIAREAVDYVTQVSALSGLPPDQAIAAAVGFRVDSYLMIEAHAQGQLIPSRVEQFAGSYRGAIVTQPTAGLYENVAALDFSSMYPSLMAKYNISPDTLETDTRDKDAFVVPEVGHRFRSKPEGFYTIAMKKLLEARKTTKTELKSTSHDSARYRMLRARDRAIKITTNAMYGYAGWSGARWYSKEVAESAAALGRDTILKAISIAKEHGLKVFYSDTDSLFVTYDKPRVEKFLDTIREKLGLEISLSETYKRILFTEAMKKYAGLREDDQIDVVGLEAIRGDWSTLSKEVQNNVLRFVLEDADTQRAVDYVTKLTRNLRHTDVPLSSYVIWKTLTKPVNKYEVNAPHVEVAKKMIKEGWPPSVGDKVGFVIVKRPGKLFQKAEPYYKVSLEQVDHEYYIHNQIVPAAARILEVLGVSEEKLLAGESRQQSLSVGAGTQVG